MFLHCYDGDTDNRFRTRNYDDIVSSYSNGDFCKIVLDPWRQSVYDYSQVLREKQRELQEELMIDDMDYESHVNFFAEMNKLGEQQNIVGKIVYGKFDEPDTQDMIEQYEKQYGSLPDKLLELMGESP